MTAIHEVLNSPKYQYSDLVAHLAIRLFRIIHEFDKAY